MPRLLFVGRLRYYKGLHILIEALRQVEGVELWIAGHGPERARLERQVASARLNQRVRFLGDVADDDLPALYRQADIFVLPSHLRAEAFGIVLVEALASGVPCISTALGTGTDFVNVHQETGLVVPPGDAAALAEAIRCLRMTRRCGRRMARQACAVRGRSSHGSACWMRWSGSIARRRTRRALSGIEEFTDIDCQP